MTIQELYNIFQGEVPDELNRLFTEMKRLVDSGLKPSIKSSLTSSGTRYYYVAADTKYVFDLPCTAVSIKVNINNHVWYIYFRHGNAWLKRDRDWVNSHVANRCLDHLKPFSNATELSHWVWSKCGQGIGFDAEGQALWRLVSDACHRLFEADKVKDPKEEPEHTKVRQHREPSRSRVAKKEVGPDLNLDF